MIPDFNLITRNYNLKLKYRGKEHYGDKVAPKVGAKNGNYG